jgi:ubiquinone/menaquinone biosynthesis C-methylase UbiE
MSFSAEEAAAGQAIYTRRMLRAYDLVVLGLSNRWIWRCPTARLERHYAEHVSANHLDVGVGSGYFLDRCRFPSAAPRIALMDLNETALTFAARRIERYAPERYRRNVLEPIAIDGAKFDSVGLSYLLHCLPGSLERKAVVFEHVRALMNPGAVVFGATLLQGGVPRSWLARRVMDLYNARRIFSNREDDLGAIERALASFRDVTVEIVGCAALFSARA